MFSLASWPETNYNIIKYTIQLLSIIEISICVIILKNVALI